MDVDEAKLWVDQVARCVYVKAIIRSQEVGKELQKLVDILDKLQFS